LEVIKESSKVYQLPPGNITSSKLAYEYVNTVFKLSSQAEEVFVVLVLNTKNAVVGGFEVSRGTLSSSPVHPREVFKRVLLLNGVRCILAHNHPSGVANPSPEDIALTKRLASAGDILGIGVIDHIIAGSDDYVSLKELEVL
jgi:DNA repair protein RadC